jgi:hypothetical protein
LGTTAEVFSKIAKINSLSSITNATKTTNFLLHPLPLICVEVCSFLYLLNISVKKVKVVVSFSLLFSFFAFFASAENYSTVKSTNASLCYFQGFYEKTAHTQKWQRQTKERKIFIL